MKRKIKKIKFKRKALKASSLTIPNTYSLVRDGCTQSLLGSFLCCRQRCLFSLNRYTLPDKTTVIFGTIFHEMLDKTHKYNMKTGKTPMNFQIVSWLKNYREIELPSMKDTKSREVFERSLLIIKVMLPIYIEFNKEDFKKKKWIEVEHSFSVNWDGILMRGKRDAIFRLKKIFNWLMEHKTKSRIDEEKILLSLSFNFQNLFYVVAAELELGIEITGVLYNIIRNPQLRIGAKESMKQFLVRLEKAIKKDPAHYFKRYEVIYLKQEKELFKKELKCIFKQYKDWLSGKEETFRNSFSCETPYTCTFLNACSSNSMNGYVKKEKLFEEL